MSEFCAQNFVVSSYKILHTQNFAQNWPTCAELTKRHRNCKVLQVLFNNIAFSSALMGTTASTECFDVKVIK